MSVKISLLLDRQEEIARWCRENSIPCLVKLALLAETMGGIDYRYFSSRKFSAGITVLYYLAESFMVIRDADFPLVALRFEEIIS